MSDDLVKRLRYPPFGTETSERNLMEEAAAEITRLRAAINDALTAPFSDPELNSTWHQEPIGPNETPEEAIKRLVSVRAEWAVHKNNCENPAIAELRAELATARDALQARVAELEGLVAYLCGRHTDHIQVALAGNPIVVDTLVKRAEAAMKGKKDE